MNKDRIILASNPGGHERLYLRLTHRGKVEILKRWVAWINTANQNGEMVNPATVAPQILDELERFNGHDPRS